MARDAGLLKRLRLNLEVMQARAFARHTRREARLLCAALATSACLAMRARFPVLILLLLRDDLFGGLAVQAVQVLLYLDVVGFALA